jgi:nickel transport protein
MRKTLLVLVLSLALPAMLCANELWVQQNGNELQVVCVPSVCGKDVVPIPCDTTDIKEFKVFDAIGKVRKSETAFKDKATVQIGNEKVTLVTVLQEEGFRSITADGEKPLSKREAKDAIETRYYLNFSKTLLSWSKAFTKPLGKGLEIVPLKNPLTLKTGDKLPIVVYYDGKPHADIWVDDRTNDGIREKTDSKGRLNVIIGKKGLQVVTAYLDTPYKDPAEADKMTFTSNLTYQVK